MGRAGTYQFVRETVNPLRGKMDGFEKNAPVYHGGGGGTGGAA